MMHFARTVFLQAALALAGILVIAVTLEFQSAAAYAEADYSKSIVLPPLRISFSQLQSVVNRSASFMKEANSSAPAFIEKLELSREELVVTIKGHEFDNDRNRLPKIIDRFSYFVGMGYNSSAPSRKYLYFLVMIIALLQ